MCLAIQANTRFCRSSSCGPWFAQLNDGCQNPIGVQLPQVRNQERCAPCASSNSGQQQRLLRLILWLSCTLAVLSKEDAECTCLIRPGSMLGGVARYVLHRPDEQSSIPKLY